MRLAATTFAVMLTVGGGYLLAAERTPPMPVPRPRVPAAPAPAVAPPASLQAPAEPSAPPVPMPDVDRHPTGSTAPHDPIAALSVHPREEQRAILRRCIVEWTRKKREGSTRGMIWRDFLEICIVRK